MAKPRVKSSLSFGGYGLFPEEDAKLLEILEEHDVSARKLVRAFLRKVIKDGPKDALKSSRW